MCVHTHVKFLSCLNLLTLNLHFSRSFTLFLKSNLGTSEMVQRLITHDAKSNNQSLIPMTHMVKGEKQLIQVAL